MKKWIGSVAGILLALAVAACSAPTGASSSAASAAASSASSVAASAASSEISSASSSASSEASSVASAAAAGTITDMLGNTVQIPEKIERIADSWPAHSEILMMLGAGDKIVATANTKQTVPWMFHINPSLSDAITTSNKDFNTEDLAAKQPDIFFMSPGNTNADKIKSMGIPTVQLNFTNYDEMKQCISLTAQVLGGDAITRADKYIQYLDNTLASVKQKTANLSAAEKPKVLHIQSLEPLKVDGSDTIIDDWITAAGGVNAAQGVKGNMKEVSMEQVLQWNPDVIIIGVNTGKDGAAELKANKAWANIKAVQDNKVYNNPSGAYGWDRYSAEEVLQVQWAAKTLHPDLFQDVNMVQMVREYYQTYLDYPLSTDEAQLILEAKPPAD